jgi:hypothetical protein
MVTGDARERTTRDRSPTKNAAHGNAETNSINPLPRIPVLSSLNLSNSLSKAPRLDDFVMATPADRAKMLAK